MVAVVNLRKYGSKFQWSEVYPAIDCAMGSNGVLGCCPTGELCSPGSFPYHPLIPDLKATSDPTPTIITTLSYSVAWKSNNPGYGSRQQHDLEQKLDSRFIILQSPELRLFHVN